MMRILRMLLNRVRRSPRRRSRHPVRPLRLERVEERRLLTLWINELHIDPLFGNPEQDQYVELRGTPNAAIAQGTYFVAVDGDGLDKGKIHTIFDLSGQTLGSNGFLVLLQGGHNYATDSAATVLTSVSPGFGGLPNNMFSDESTLTDRIDFVIGSNTFLLIQSAVAPRIGDDIDADDNAVPDGVFAHWTVLDSISFLQGGTNDIGYGKIIFRTHGGGMGLAGSPVVEMTHRVSYAARIGDSTGSAPSDWVAGTTTERASTSFQFRLERGTFGSPAPPRYAGRDLDHIGAPNFFSTISGTVFEDANGDGVQNAGEAGVAGVSVYADLDFSDAADTVLIRAEPDDFPHGTDLTNLIPGATLTTANSKNEMLSFKVRSQSAGDGPSSTGQSIFASEGIPWFDNGDRLRVDFYAPVESVSIDVIGVSNLSSVYGRIEAFNEAGESLGFTRSRALLNGHVERITISRDQADIAFVAAYCDDTYLSSSPFGRFDNLSFVQREPTAVTDSQGVYRLQFLPPRIYDVQPVLPSGKLQTSPRPSGTHTVAVDGTEHKTGVNFGIRSNGPPSIADQRFSINENPPVGFTVGAVAAHDADIGQKLTFRIRGGTGQGIFAIAPATGTITVLNAAPLDYETAAPFTLVVEVEDDHQPPASQIATVTIELQDINEPPIIPAQSFEVEEGALPGTEIGIVTATDPDAGAAGQFTFSITLGNTGSAFEIDPATGRITVAAGANIDYETTPQYNLTIRATDQGDPPRFSSRILPVTVKNRNEAPLIEPQSFTLAENSPQGFEVGTVAVFDPDSADVHTFEVLGGTATGIFAVDAATGKITVHNSAALDFETVGPLNLIVQVTDSGTPSLSATGTITFVLTDVNDVPTLADQEFDVDENSPPGLSVGTIVAHDADAGQFLQFAIVGGTGASAFSIDSSSGVLRVADSALLDAEAAPVLTLVIRVTDNGVPPLSTERTLNVRINDVNERPSIPAQSFSVEENSPTGFVVGRVSAIDDDASDTLTFAIVGGSGAAVFTLDPDTGDIAVADSAALDAETTSVFQLDVEVRDRAGLSAVGTVTINLLDVNEFDPVLVTTSLAVNENSPAGQLVGFVTATDGDATSTFSFAIVGGNANSAFALDAATGRITVQTSSALDHETQAEQVLSIRVSDGGQPPRSSTGNVTITIRDVNEFTPTMNDFAFQIAEHSPVGTEVGRLTASDLDRTQTFRFAIISGNDQNLFALEAETGVISVSDPAALDFEQASTHLLQVQVTDSGQPPRSATSLVMVTLTNVNEPPRSISLTASSVRENLLGAVIGALSAQDPEPADTHVFSVDDHRFEVVRGQLKLKADAAVVRDESGQLAVSITATDSGTPPQSHTQVFQLTVLANPTAWRNTETPLDANNDNFVTPGDALVIINQLNSPDLIDRFGRIPRERAADSKLPFYDVNGDGFVTPADALIIINHLNSAFDSEGESALASKAPRAPAGAREAVFRRLGESAGTLGGDGDVFNVLGLDWALRSKKARPDPEADDEPW